MLSFLKAQCALPPLTSLERQIGGVRVEVRVRERERARERERERERETSTPGEPVVVLAVTCTRQLHVM